MSNEPDVNQSSDKYVTWTEFKAEIKSFRMEFRLLLVVGLGAIKFDLPDTVTVGSVATVFTFAALKSFLAR